MFGLMTRRRHDAELAAAKAAADRLRDQRDQARTESGTFRTSAQIAARQFAATDATDATNRRLAGRNLELGRRISQLTEADPEYAAALETRVARLRVVGARVLAAYGRERRRADGLQERLDDAVGLHHGHVEDSGRWQPGSRKPSPGVAL